MAHAHAHPTRPGFSLLRLSVVQRLSGVVVISALLWAAVAWALS